MLTEYKADLHIHTCLSPCADNGMTPLCIVDRAKGMGLDVIGICDHNSSENAAACKKAGAKAGLKVIIGMEVTTSEEIHLLALFENLGDLYGFQKLVYKSLPGKNDEEKFGMQVVMDENDEIKSLNERLLIGATCSSVNEIVKSIHGLGGLVFASHIDRERFSIISQLGYIPEGMALDALEVSTETTIHAVKKRIPSAKGYPLVAFSDAHFPDDIGKAYTVFFMEYAGIAEIKKALLGSEGRKVVAFPEMG